MRATMRYEQRVRSNEMVTIPYGMGFALNEFALTGNPAWTGARANERASYEYAIDLCADADDRTDYPRMPSRRHNPRVTDARQSHRRAEPAHQCHVAKTDKVSCGGL